jgi:outer membrane protein assembly factor BamB
MHKILCLVILSLFITSCDSFGTKKVKTIVELAPKLSVDSSDPIVLSKFHEDIVDFSQASIKKHSYNLTKNNLISKPTFAKGKIFSIDDKGIVSAFSVEEKKILWTRDVSYNQYDPNYAGGGISYKNDKLYITNGSRYLIILDSKTGYEILRKEFADIIRTKPLLLSENKILIQTISNQVFVYNISNASTTLWHETILETLASGHHVNPMEYNSKVIISYSSGLIVALNANSGESIWELNIGDIREEGSGEDARISTDPLIYKGSMYLASNAGSIYKIDANNGNIIWTKNASDIVSMSIEGDHLFITNNARQVAAIDIHDSKIKWVGNLAAGSKNRPKPEFFVTPFMVQDKLGNANLVVVGSSGVIYSFFYQDHILSTVPTIQKISKNMSFGGKSCCDGSMYLISNKQIIFLE